jgi:hypothetical protein
MSARRFVSSAVALLLLGSVAACGASTGLPVAPLAASSPAGVATAPPASAAPRATAVPSATATLPPTGSGPPATTESVTETIDYGNFSDPTTIDNTWFPLRPGTKLAHTGAGNVDGVRTPHRVVMVVTDLTKVIDGIRTVLIYELDYDEDDLVEAELAFFAEDDDGNVWHFGQYPEVFEDGKLIETPVWIAGQRGAKAGITIKAEPQAGGPSYSQGWGPEVGWADRARVFEIGSRTCVQTGCYDGVLVTDEFNRDEPDAHQLKYYAPGIGVVRVGWAGALEEEREELELVEITSLDAAELAAVRAEVLAAEARAYANSTDVYGETSPLER